MKRILLTTIGLLTTLLYAQTHTKGTLVWSDEFNTAGPLNEADWNYEHGFVRNYELQWYQPDNAICRDGCLIITARHEQVNNPHHAKSLPNGRRPDWRQKREYAEYTSASVNTRGKHEFLFGTLEVRARIPIVEGSWPAIWTLGSQWRWPSCGEIDVMEYYRIDDVPHILANAAWGNDHNQAVWNTKTIPFAHFLELDPAWADKFHIWRMEWKPEYLRIYLDDELLNDIDLTRTINGTYGEHKNPFHTPHYFLLNLAIGGQHGGLPAPEKYPIRYEIDYIRFYQQTEQ
ncbi:MAG: glycoside hydrolase family 16 protein [Bacteroidaceae bacterium]|nr:glycoside hydrolase family 16 protein [Bacteroidaceae bacterium]